MENKQNSPKMLGEQRRSHVLDMLKKTGQAYTGTALSEETGVSRQVIVQDIALLKAKEEPIVATPQGYLYISQNVPQQLRRVIACQHQPKDTERELNILVDHGVRVIDVIVEHPFYGEIQGSLRLSSREDVRKFIEKWQASNAHLLSSLTEGIHLHTIEAPEQETLDQACAALSQAGILFEQNDD